MILSEREQSNVTGIKSNMSKLSLVEKAKRYDEDVTRLIGYIDRINTVSRMISEEKIELAELRKMREKVLTFADSLGILYRGPTA